MFRTDFHRIIAMNTISGIGAGLIGIFIPIYLLEHGHSVFTVVMWLIVHHTSLLGGAFLVAYISGIIGLVQCWYVRIALVVALFAGLFLVPAHPSILFLVAIISGIEAAFFWIPYNILTVRKTEEKTMGSSLALASNIASAFGIVVPGIAALIIVTYGYNLLFILAFICILASILPVLALRHEKVKFRFDLSHIKSVIKENKHFIVPEILDNLGQDAQVMWTLFLFVTSFTILDIGALGVISGIVGMVVTHITGKWIDASNKKTVVRFGAIATTVAWVLSYVVAIYMPTPVALYVVTTLRGFALGIFMSAYGVIMFNRARASDEQFILLREIPTIVGRVIVFSLALFFLSIDRFELSFLMVAGISIYFWFNDIDSLMGKRAVASPAVAAR